MASLETVQFLIVDDNLHVLEIVKAIVRGFGVRGVVEATSGDEAIRHLRQNTVDIVILDYRLGEDDGLDFLRRLRTNADSPAPNIPVIMLTSHSERVRVEAARDAGVNAFCAKPVVPVELWRKIVEVVDRPRDFVRTDTYYGPDRRRRDDPQYAGPERRQDRIVSTKPPKAASDL